MLFFCIPKHFAHLRFWWKPLFVTGKLQLALTQIQFTTRKNAGTAQQGVCMQWLKALKRIKFSNAWIEFWIVNRAKSEKKIHQLLTGLNRLLSCVQWWVKMWHHGKTDENQADASESTNLETVLTASCKAMQIPMIKSDIGFYPNILFWCMSKEWLKDRDMNRVVAKDQIGPNRTEQRRGKSIL